MNDRVQALERMLASRPDDARLRFGLALEYLNRDRLDDGIEALRAYLSLAERQGTPDEGNAWGRLGAALLQAGRDAEAYDAYREGAEAVRRHGHPSMAEEFEAILADAR